MGSFDSAGRSLYEAIKPMKNDLLYVKIYKTYQTLGNQCNE